MAQRKKQLIAEGKLDKHGRPNAETPPEYLRALPDANGCETALPRPSCEVPGKLSHQHRTFHQLSVSGRKS